MNKERSDLGRAVSRFEGFRQWERVTSSPIGDLAMAQISQFCTFYLDRLLFGVELKGVQEVMRSLDMTACRLRPTWSAG